MPLTLQRFARRLALLAATTAGTALAQDDDRADVRGSLEVAREPDFVVAFGPFVGGGRTDAGSRVRHASGYSLAVERPFAIGSAGLTIGPRLELGNSFINTKDKVAAVTAVSTYDTRLLGAGVTLSQKVGTPTSLAQKVYLAATAGKGYSKITLDETSETAYRQSELENMSGNWFQGELGTFMPLKGALGVSLALIGSRLEIDQSAAHGTFRGDEVQEDGSLALVSGSVDNEREKKLAEKASFDTLALRLGLSIGF
jgi:hypothetical protein